MQYKGLTDKEVEASRKKYGSNEIPDSEPTTFWEEFDCRADDHYVFFRVRRNL